MIQGWNWYAGSDPTQIGAGQYDFETTMLHELGHSLGLGGSTDTTSPMYETLASGVTHRTITARDLNIPDPPAGADPLTAVGFHRFSTVPALPLTAAIGTDAVPILAGLSSRASVPVYHSSVSEQNASSDGGQNIAGMSPHSLVGQETSRENEQCLVNWCGLATTSVGPCPDLPQELSTAPRESGNDSHFEPNIPPQDVPSDATTRRHPKPVRSPGDGFLNSSATVKAECEKLMDAGGLDRFWLAGLSVDSSSPPGSCSKPTLLAGGLAAILVGAVLHESGALQRKGTSERSAPRRAQRRFVKFKPSIE